jgi:hypothetical protein
MPGLSVTPLHPEPWWTRPLVDWVARRLCKYLELADRTWDRRPWVLTGNVVGYGPDHEPLVDNVRPLACRSRPCTGPAAMSWYMFSSSSTDAATAHRRSWLSSPRFRL